jgi:adenylate cyclase class 2
MNSEIEAKFLNVDHDAVRKQLQAIGGVQKYPSRLMRRLVVQNDVMKESSAYVRVRDEGDKVTLTYKRKDANTVDGMKELETEVKDFETAANILRALDFQWQSYQESKREKWMVGEVEVVLDEWPWLAPLIEIEGSSEQAIREVAEKLGFDWNNAMFGSVMTAYRAQYPWLGPGDKIGQLPEVRFDDPTPEMFEKP